MDAIPALTSPEPPVVTRLISADGQSYALSGWTEFLRWARDNDPFVHDIDQAARRLGYGLGDRERVLLHALLIDRLERQRSCRMSYPDAARVD